MIAPEYFRPPRLSTFAHLSPVPHLIPRGLSDHRGKRGNDGPGERNVRGRRPELAGRLRLVRMLARLRRVRRRRLTLTTHPSHRSAERVASTTPPVPLFFRSSDPVRGAGVEPAQQAWKACVIPLDYPRSVGGLDRGYLSPSSGHGLAFVDPSFRSASSSSIAARRSCTSSPSFSRSRAIRRAFGIVCFVSHSRVSFRSFVGFGRFTPLRAIVPSRLTIVSPNSCRAYIARLSQRSGLDESADCPRRGPLAISISHPLSMSATCPTRP